MDISVLFLVDYVIFSTIFLGLLTAEFYYLFGRSCCKNRDDEPLQSVKILPIGPSSSSSTMTTKEKPSGRIPMILLRYALINTVLLSWRILALPRSYLNNPLGMSIAVVIVADILTSLLVQALAHVASMMYRLLRIQTNGVDTVSWVWTTAIGLLISLPWAGLLTSWLASSVTGKYRYRAIYYLTISIAGSGFAILLAVSTFRLSRQILAIVPHLRPRPADDLTKRTKKWTMVMAAFAFIGLAGSITSALQLTGFSQDWDLGYWDSHVFSVAPISGPAWVHLLATVAAFAFVWRRRTELASEEMEDEKASASTSRSDTTSRAMSRSNSAASKSERREEIHA